MIRHFLDIHQLSYDDAIALMKRALYFKQTGHRPDYSGRVLATVFYENSTRTRISFELAAKALGMTVIHVDVARSSEQKGETPHDTIKTLAAMGVDIVVVRHSEADVPQALAEQAPEGIQIINAGDGINAHPTQAMLDGMTMMACKPSFPAINIAVVGNIKHSRVAHSLQSLCALLNVNRLTFVAPPSWCPSSPGYAHVTTSLKEGLMDADVVVALRVQLERFMPDDWLDMEQYRQAYAITKQHLSYAASDAIVMHPGPVNRGVEIDSDVVDGPQSRIWDQVSNGVFMRMALLERLLS